jgi:hypothetical protein
VKVLKVPVYFAPFIEKLIPVPFGIFVIYTDVSTGRPPGRNRIYSPVNENSEFRIFKPGRCRTLIERFPGGFVGLTRQRSGDKNKEDGKEKIFHNEIILCRIQDSRFKIQNSRFKVQDSRFKITGSR